LKKEAFNVTKRYYIGSKTLEYILSIQITYYNNFGLGRKITNDLQNDFPRFKERTKQRPLKIVYKHHLKNKFVKPVGRSFLKCSIYRNPYHFKNDCPKGWRPVWRNFLNMAKLSNRKGPEQIWVLKKA